MFYYNIEQKNLM